VSLMFERRRDKPSPTAVIDRVSSGWSHLISTHLASDSRCKCDGTNKHRHARAVRSAVIVHLQFFTRTPHIVGLSIVAVWMAVAAPKGIVG
jgi:hypothetical protein